MSIVLLLEAGSYLGTFASVSPNTPGSGLTWDTSSLPLDGRLNVLVDTADEDGDGMTNLQEFLAAPTRIIRPAGSC